MKANATKTKIMNMKEIDKQNATRNNAYIIDTNKYIEHDTSKPITTNMREKATDKYVLEKTRTRINCFKNVRQTVRVGL